ncbi:MAG: hypothetical protein FWB71_01830 [Defluviitaleaceae bacterium]|nr:hypothetical protein [Defluviitaleaceae bacterium]
MVIQTNTRALNAHRHMGATGVLQARSSNRLSSGKRINSAADDAAGLAISEKMRAQISGLEQAWRNSQDGISLVQVAEGAMGTVSSMVIRARELVIQAANDTNTMEDRAFIQREIDEIMDEINMVADRTEFNTRTLLDGSMSSAGVVNLSTAQTAAMGAFITDPANAPLMQDRNDAITSHLEGIRVLAGLEDELEFVSELRNSILSTITMNTVNQALQEAQSTWASLLTFDPNQATDLAAQTNFLLSHLNSTFGTNLSALPPGVVGNVGDPTGSGADVPPAAIPETIEALRDNAVIRALSNEELQGRFWFDTYYGNGGTNDTRDIDNMDDLTDRANELWQHIDNGRSRVANDSVAVDVANVALNQAIGTNPLLNATGHTFEQLYAAFTNTQPDGSIWLHIGPNDGQGFSVSIGGVNTEILGRPRGDLADMIDVHLPHGWDIGFYGDHISLLDEALFYINGERAKLGAIQNRLEFAGISLSIGAENLSASMSRIRDADMALEMFNYTQSNILQQATTSMLAQANQSAQDVLQLLQA